MKSFLVIGMGRFGSSTARKLCALGNEVLAIDRDPDVIQHIADDVTQAIVGDAADEAVIRAVGARNFDCAIVCMASDLENSILTTALLKEEGVKYVIAKASSPLHRLVLQRVGADRIVFPEEEMGVRLAQSVSARHFIDFMGVTDSFSIAEMAVPADWVGKSLIDVDVRNRFGVNVLAVREENSETLQVNPSPREPMRAGTVLVMIGANEDLERVGGQA